MDCTDDSSSDVRDKNGIYLFEKFSIFNMNNSFSVNTNCDLCFFNECYLQGSDSFYGELDDCVVLGRQSKYKNINWKFPQTTKCPLDACRISCSSRNVAIKHFLNNHADTTTMCTVCDTLLSVQEIEKHCMAYHPNKAPLKLKPVSYRCFKIICI